MEETEGENEESRSVAPYVGQRFASWTEAEKYLDNYARSQCFQWCTHSSCSVKNENLKLKGRGVSEDQYYSEGLVHKNIILTCVSGGLKRTNRGKGDRPIQSTWKIDCAAKVQLIASQSHLQIVKFVSEHNHKLDQAYFDTLPKSRRQNLGEEKATATAKTLFQAGVKPCVVRTILRSLGCGQVQSRDLSNLRAKWKRDKLGGNTPEQKLVETLEEILTTDPEAYIHIGKSDNDELEFLFIQTSCMRKTMQKFGSVLLMDHTYKINKNKMPVTVFLCMDGNGNGRASGYAFVANEKAITIEQVMRAFVSSLEEPVSSQVKSVIIDKDYSEVKAILNVLPNVSIQLCDFHVARTFDKKTKKENELVKKLLHQLRFCCNDEEFDNLVLQLKKEASDSFFSYFDNNWLTCSLAWSFRDKKKAINLGNTTNNRLENHNSKIKMMLNQHNELFEAVDNLLQLIRNKEEDVFFLNNMDSVKETYYMHSGDPIVQKVLHDLTRFSAKLVLWEFKQIVPETEVTAFKANSLSCSCPHWCSYFLPCRHIFQHRRLFGNPLYNLEEIDQRWHKTYQLADEPHLEVHNNLANVVCQNVPSRLLPQTWNDKFNHSLSQCKVLCGILSECGQDQYIKRYNLLVELAEMWSAGKEIVLAEFLDSSSSIGNQILAVGKEVQVEVISTETDSSKEEKLLYETVEEKPSLTSLHSSSISSKLSPVSNGTTSTESTMLQFRTDESIQESEHKTSISFQQDLTSPDPINANLPAMTEPAHISVDVNPICWCNLSTIRLVAKPPSRMAGRPFYKCVQNKCRFWRLAKSNLISKQETDLKECGTDLESLLDDGEANLKDLISVMDILEKTDPLVLASIPLTPEASAKATLKTALEGITLPQAVKHKGRPQGLGKTIPEWSKSFDKAKRLSSKPPSGTLLKSSVLYDGEDARKARGCAIPDNDIEEIDTMSHSWRVRSQGKQEQTAYLVARVNWDDKCNMCGSAPCPHSYSCECHDNVFRKQPCKHIYKIHDYVSKLGKNSPITSQQSSIVGNDLKSGFSLHPNVTVRKRKDPWPDVAHPSKLMKISSLNYPWSAKKIVDVSEKLDYYVKGFKISDDLKSLSPQKWLTDKMIDCFLAVVSEPDFLWEPDAAVLTFESLALECATMGLQSIFDRAKRAHMFLNDIWLVPTHVTRLLLNISHAEISGANINWNEWRIYAPSDMGIQTNTYDCGICVCIWAFSILSASVPPSVPDICTASVNIRNWMRCELLCKARQTPKVDFKIDDSDQQDEICELYSDFDEKVNSGSLVMKKPWLHVPSPVVEQGLVDDKETIHMLSEILKNLWMATDKVCGAKRCVGSKQDMYFCELCREYFHLLCVADMRKPPSLEELYMCPLHSALKTKTRTTCKPLRFRRSLD